MAKKNTKQKRPILGWSEWIGLPELGIDKILAKVDTGARTSALHAFRVEPFTEKGIKKVSFDIHPVFHSPEIISCICVLHDVRMVTDSGGHREQRYVIKTPFKVNNKIWPIEITLTNRDTMSFRMLLGRTALARRFYVDPSKKNILTEDLFEEE